MWEATRFFDDECKAWYDTRKEQGVDFVINKNVEMRLDEELGIPVAFHNMGYTNIAKVKGA